MTYSGSGDKKYSGGNASDNFKSFLEGWMVRQEHYLDELVSAQQNCHESQPDDDLKELINRVLSHYQQYYQHKSIAAADNVFDVFSPDWFTSFEKSFLWIAGFKPALAFKLVANSVADMSDDQTREVSRLAEETRAEERILADELAKVQESVAAPPLLEQARASGRVTPVVDGEITNVEAAIEVLRAAMESVVASADLLRMSTAVKVVDVLSPAQGVRFLTAATQLHLKIRSWGLQRDAKEREEASDVED